MSPEAKDTPALVAVSGLVNLETTIPVRSFPSGPADSDETPGMVTHPSGVALNVTTALSTLGTRVRLAAITGPDAVGQLVRTHLSALPGVEVEHVPHVKTAQTVVLQSPEGDRVILRDAAGAPGADLGALPTFTGCAAFVPTNIAANVAAVARARAAGVRVLVDLQAPAEVEEPWNLPFCEAAEVLAMSDARISLEPTAWLRALGERYGTSVIVLGMGAAGAMLATDAGRRVEHVPAIASRPVRSTLGAGDALWGCFVDGYLRGLEPLASLHRAVTFAGHKIGAVGGSQGMPTIAELDALMRSYWGTEALRHSGTEALGTEALGHWGTGALGHWGTGALSHWGTEPCASMIMKVLGRWRDPNAS